MNEIKLLNYTKLAHSPKPDYRKDFSSYQKWRMARIYLGLPTFTPLTDDEKKSRRAKRFALWYERNKRK